MEKEVDGTRCVDEISPWSSSIGASRDDELNFCLVRAGRYRGRRRGDVSPTRRQYVAISPTTTRPSQLSFLKGTQIILRTSTNTLYMS